MVQFLFTNKDVESLKGLYRIMANGFVSSQALYSPDINNGVCVCSLRVPNLIHHSVYLDTFSMSVS